ncbi:MAG TPA: threonine ammonia-lyase [Gaiellales bacterium]|jgi:threonine dehydratase|nr:threonine ammonia-lyase [Gaiellales bacterium]
MVTPDNIRRAAERLREVAHRTPLTRSETFSRQAGCDVMLKHENRQKTGSFKIRGAYNRISALAEDQRPAGVVAPSAGNHAQAVAWAARLAGVPAIVYMPEAASLAKVGATEGYGATVRLVGASVEESVAAAREEAERGHRVLVHPFDDELVIAGQGTVGLEILEDAPDVDVIVVPLGGGGLLSGIAAAVKAVRPEVRVVGVEAAGCAPYVGSLEQGEIRPVPQTETIADGIAVKHPGEITFGMIRELVDDVVTVTDAEIGQAIVQLLEREKIVVEGAGAVGLAALLSGRVSGRRAVAVLSGGNIDTPLLMQVIRFGLTTAGRYVVIRTRLTDRPGELMELLKVIADAHVNILLISHHRESVDVAVAETGIELTLETRDEAHAHAIVELVRDAGYPVTRMH